MIKYFLFEVFFKRFSDKNSSFVLAEFSLVAYRPMAEKHFLETNLSWFEIQSLRQGGWLIGWVVRWLEHLYSRAG